jgi:hypothetical protein
MSDEDVLQEVELLGSMFADDIDVGENADYKRLEVTMALAGGFELQINVPLTGEYPERRHPDITVPKGPNAVFVSELERDIRRCVSELPLGQPVLIELVMQAQALAEDAKAAIDAEEAAVTAAASQRKQAQAEAHAAAPEETEDP